MSINSEPPGQANSLVQDRQLEAEKLSLSEYVPGLQVSQLMKCYEIFNLNKN